VIIGASALLELELAPAPVASEPDVEDVFVTLLIDEFDADVGVDAVVSVDIIVAPEFVGRAPAVNVTGCPAPRAAPPSVKLVNTSDIVVVEPAISAVPDPEQAPIKLEYKQPMSTVLSRS
jgi:hypothetical protein